MKLRRSYRLRSVTPVLCIVLGVVATDATSAATTWTKIADEWRSFTVTGTQLVRYGSGSTWIEKNVTNGGQCTNAYFGRDPLVGVTKQCQVASNPITSPPVAPTQVILRWAQPSANATVKNTIQLQLNGQAFQNVEIFRNGQMIARATVSPDRTTATASIDTTSFPDGPLTLTAHAWNSPAGTSFTSEAAAGGLNLVVNNASVPPVNNVALAWVQPTANATLSGTVDFRLTGQAFKNVEIFRDGQRVARATISADQRTATASIDTKQFPNGTVTFTAHAWNSAPGTAFTSDADAGALSFTINNTVIAPPPPPPPPSSTGFWPSGTSELNRDFQNAFGTWRGRPSTSAWINLLWLKWDWLTAPGLHSTLNNRDPVKVWDLYNDFPGVAVLSMSMAGTDSQSQAQYDASMRACADGAYNDEWATFAENATAAGRNSDNTVVSLAQEFNGTWFKWHPGNVGLDIWKRCWRNVYFAIKSKSTLRVAWVFSATTVTRKGGDWSVNNVWEAYPGDDAVDIIGVNRYDFPMFGAKTIDWRSTCWNTQDICYAADYARRVGKSIGLPEWSPDRQKGYADNAEFIDMMYGFFSDNADILAFENTFNHILSGTPGYWHVYPQSSINTKASARYKERWRVQ